MKVAILIPPNDFKDESVSSSKAMLERWDVTPVITSYSNKDCVGQHGAVYKPDINTGRLNPDDFDAIIFIDGNGVDSYKLYDFRPLLDTVKRFSDRKKPVCAIGNSVKIIARANIIQNVKVAAPKDEETNRLVALYRGIKSENAIESDKGIMTLNNSELVDDFVGLLLEKLGVK
ncbi:MAG: DJ-1/PfpI family protein [Candidatus Micrarchaeota archaeon]|nr:DJ-1/PfpI family protein [Candidatus Micrarchaeota archaeon]